MSNPNIGHVNPVLKVFKQRAITDWLLLMYLMADQRLIPHNSFIRPFIHSFSFSIAPLQIHYYSEYCIVLYSSINIAPINSHGQTEALLVRLAPRKETSFKK